MKKKNKHNEKKPCIIKRIFDKIKGFFKRLVKWIQLHIYGILYFILIVTLSVYIVLNWDKCISMKFFEQFDGNNILFLVWIALLILFFYDVEAKDLKFHRKKFEATRDKINSVESKFILQSKIENMIDDLQFQNTEKTDERSINNEQ